jgi:hypothetical protein
MPLIIAACPERAERDHLGLGRSSGTWWGAGKVDSDDDGMLAGGWGGVAGGEMMPGRDDSWRVEVMGR